ELVEAFVGRRFETKKDVEVLRDRPPRVEQVGVARHQIGAALNEQPPLADSASRQLTRQLEATCGLVPEQIVGDKDVRPGGREIPADAVDRSQPDRAVVHLPYR